MPNPIILRTLMAVAFISFLTATSSAFASESAAATTSNRPNILVIVSDDQGYADTGFQGCKDIPTPQLDGLARAGIRCTNGYVSHMYCSPTRAGLMTGRYQARFGHEHNPHFNPNDHREGLPMSERILPQFLSPAHYATGWIGKWHLGAAKEFRPENRGFQETFGFIGGGHHFLNWQVKPEAEYNVPIERNGKPVEVKEHLTLAFGHEASAFVRRHETSPWFLYLAFNAPHAPNEPTPERLERFKAIKSNLRRRYAAQVSLMDDAIGEVLQTLRDSKQERRTLVFFFSDNGGQTLTGAVNTPLRGKKGDVYEGGIRVPFVVSWPGTLPAGRDFVPAVSSLDVFATALGCAGVPMPTDRPYDSVNLIPYLSGEKQGPPHDRLFWRRNEALQASMRQGDKKLVRDAKRPDELYDLAADISETRNLAGDNATTVADLNTAFDAWFAQMVKKPAFPGEGGPEREWPSRKVERASP